MTMLIVAILVPMSLANENEENQQRSERDSQLREQLENAEQALERAHDTYGENITELNPRIKRIIINKMQDVAGLQMEVAQTPPSSKSYMKAMPKLKNTRKVISMGQNEVIWDANLEGGDAGSSVIPPIGIWEHDADASNNRCESIVTLLPNGSAWAYGQVGRSFWVDGNQPEATATVYIRSHLHGLLMATGSIGSSSTEVQLELNVLDCTDDRMEKETIYEYRGTYPWGENKSINDKLVIGSEIFNFKRDHYYKVWLEVESIGSVSGEATMSSDFSDWDGDTGYADYSYILIDWI
ncbi:MAG: hypothetical protein R6U89_05725 [Dehalococcoidia bacterium]